MRFLRCLYCWQLFGVGCSVCFWLLQCNAYLYAAWLSGNGAVQAENLVYLLSDGYYDADDLQNETIVCKC